MRYELIVARALNGVIGRQGSLPWRLPDDLRHFRTTTAGKTVVVGRTTWETLPALPGRRVVVMSKTMNRSAAQERGVLLVRGWFELAHLTNTLGIADREVILAGGAQLYASALREGLVSRVHLTTIYARPLGDSYLKRHFWPWAWRKLCSTPIYPRGCNDHAAAIETLERRRG